MKWHVTLVGALRLVVVRMLPLALAGAVTLLVDTGLLGGELGEQLVRVLSA